MSRGGSRPGAGRPRKPSVRFDKVPKDIQAEAKSEGMSPLEYMLKVMRNPEADQQRRDRMAVSAAPFCHARVADVKGGKKEAAAEAAKTAGEGWEDDLEFESGRPN